MKEWGGDRFLVVRRCSCARCGGRGHSVKSRPDALDALADAETYRVLVAGVQYDVRDQATGEVLQ